MKACQSIWLKWGLGVLAVTILIYVPIIISGGGR